ncbi:MAG: response regulator transcription factor [Ferrovum myxofaciens]|uniref:response regulator n=1 Tax=Ferrovum myxofaciens TaxID=416213 RepID=UPI002355B16F|nr:response regulator transcription factor [Ferrovum myxofaciens]QKE40389.1 MAG: response regulator transcription factor [Ferrovum myxofaciens]
MIRLLIADDHAIVREGLRQLMMLTEDIKVTGEATNGQEVLEQVGNTEFDLLLLDLNMPGINGIELIERVKTCRPTLLILVYSMHNEVHMATSALNAGCSGYFTKDSDPKMLASAIRKVSSGGKYIGMELAEKMIFDNAYPQLLPHTLLSTRELEILRLLVVGMSVNEIASQLFISNKTVSTHKANLMEKMKFHSIADLVRYAMQHGISG